MQRIASLSLFSQAEHIEEGYEERGVPKDEAERRA